jgi:phosphoribosylglycinamide formyltransferase 2
LISQDLSQFELHLRAILGLPIPEISYWGPAASAVILADFESEKFSVSGLEEALRAKQTEVKISESPQLASFAGWEWLLLAQKQPTRPAKKPGLQQVK